MLFRLLILGFSWKTDYDTKIGEIENKITDHDHNKKYITVKELNKLTSENFAARLKQANLATKADIKYFLEKADFDDRLKNFKKLLGIKQNM